MKKNAKREGFTLVELLIVIVVIGVLSAMMMLSSTEAVSSAKAADIVSDLRNLKTAALAYYADHLDDVEKGTGDFASGKGLENADTRKAILKYMNNESADAKYQFRKGINNDKEWYAFCNNTDGKVASKLDSRKGSVGLYATANSSDKTSITAGAYIFIR